MARGGYWGHAGAARCISEPGPHAHARTQGAWPANAGASAPRMANATPRIALGPSPNELCSQPGKMHDLNIIAKKNNNMCVFDKMLV